MADVFLTDGDDFFDARTDPATDWIDAKGGNDTVILGDDGYTNGPGDDTIIGTAATSAIWVAGPPGPVYIDLAQGFMLDGFGGRDTLSGIRVIWGGGQPTNLIGSPAAETYFSQQLFGDTISGGGGYDVVNYYPTSRADVRLDRIDERTVTVTRLDNGRADRLTDIAKVVFEDDVVLPSSPYAVQTHAWVSAPGIAAGGGFNFGAADFNGDGLFDLVVAPTVAPPLAVLPQPVIVLMRQPDGSFVQARVIHEAPGMITPRDLVFGDFDGDGRTDAFLAGHGYDAAPFTGEANRVLMNKGDGSFVLRYAPDAAPSDFSHSTAIGDIDRDGDLDVFVGNLAGGPPHVKPYFLRNEAGTLVRDDSRLPPALDYDLGGAAVYTASALADVNGDGWLDLVLGCDTFSRSTLFLNDGTGHFPDSGKVILPPGLFGETETTTISMVAADFDRDGRPDLLLTQTGFGYVGRGLQVLVQDSNGVYVDETAARMPDVDPGQMPITLVHLVDFDRDGHLDIVEATDIPAPRLYLNDGTGTFRSNGLAAGFNDTIGGRLVPLEDGKLARIDVNNGMLVAHVLEARAAGLTGPGNTLPALAGAPGFNEDYYLAQNPSVAAAVSVGTYANGLAHYLAAGKALGYAGFAPHTWVHGHAGADTIVLREGHEKAFGYAGDDRFVGGGGDDTIDGGAGIDTTVYAGARAGFTIARDADGRTITVSDLSGAEGSDTLIDVERIEFADRRLAFDLGGAAGDVARLIGAAFGASHLIPAYVAIGLDLFDGGWSRDGVAELALSTGVFQELAGSRANADVVNWLYTNVVGNAPSAEIAAPFVALLESGMSQAQLLLIAAGTEYTAAKVDLVGLSQSGLAY